MAEQSGTLHGARRTSWVHTAWRLFRFAGVSALLLYLAAATTMFLAQRVLLFDTRDSGNLARPGALAIEDSERVTITTTDGERLAAWFVAPKPGQPVFLFLHGKGGNLEFKTGRWSRIKAHGAGVLALSYRGYVGSTGHPSEAGLRLDARAAYDWLHQRYPADRIVIHGLSLGSGVAVELAATVDARALILEAPFTAAVDIAAERYPWLPVSLLMIDQFRSRATASPTFTCRCSSCTATATASFRSLRARHSFAWPTSRKRSSAFLMATTIP